MHQELKIGTLKHLEWKTFKGSRKLVKKSMNIFYQEWKHEEHLKKNMNIFYQKWKHQEHLKKNMSIFYQNRKIFSWRVWKIFSSFQLKIWVMKRSKLQAFLSKWREEWGSLPLLKNGYNKRRRRRWWWFIPWRWWRFDLGRWENSWDLLKMMLVVFRSYLQRPKDEVFEGLSERFWWWWWWRKEEGEEEEEEVFREKWEDLVSRERMRRVKMKMDDCGRERGWRNY